MSERQPRKPGLAPSPVPFALLIILVTVVLLGAVYLFTMGMTVPATSQSGAYVPGPTASLEELMPIEDWAEYTNEQQRFTIKYPANWYLHTTSTGQTTQIYSYDLTIRSGDQKGPPLDVTRIDIMVNRVDWAPEEQFRENETIREWVYRRREIEEGDRLIREEELAVDGLPALQQIVQFETEGLIQVVYVKRPEDVILIVQHFRENWTVPNEIFDLLVQNFRFVE